MPPQSDSIPTAASLTPAYVTYEATAPDGRREFIRAATAGYAKAAVRFAEASRSRATAASDGGLSPGVRVRGGYDRDDYEWFRPGAALPSDPRDVMAACMAAKDYFGLVGRAVELMADFAVKGVRVAHPTPQGQKVGKQWADRVNLQDVCRQLADLLFTCGAAPFSRRVGRLPAETVEALKTAPPPKPGSEFRGPVKLADGELPLGYLVRDPRSLEVIGGEAAAMAGPDAVRYGVRVGGRYRDELTQPTVLDTSLLANLTPAARQSLGGDGTLTEFPKSRFGILFYRKFDFQLFPRPMLYPVIRDLQMLEKLRLTEEAAADGATQYTRLWTLGRLDDKYQIVPDPEYIQQLADMLLANTGGAGRDLIWGPDLDFKETSTDLHRFFGAEKFAATLHRIYQGLAFPQGLTGVRGGQDEADLFISMKALLERLACAREVVHRFVAGELELLREAFRVRDPFTVTFEVPDLTDEAAAKRLLLEMYDRSLVGTEFVQEHLGAVPEVEAVRLKRDARLRDRGKLPPKVGPFEAGVGGDADGPGSPGSNGEGGADGGGRPPGSKDKQPRKRRGASPAPASPGASPAAVARAEAARRAADAVLRPVYLAHKGKANARQLSAAEADECERFVWAVVCALDPASPVTGASVLEALDRNPAVPPAVDRAHAAAVAAFSAGTGKPPTLDEDRLLRAAVLAGVPAPAA